MYPLPITDWEDICCPGLKQVLKGNSSLLFQAQQLQQLCETTESL